MAPAVPHAPGVAGREQAVARLLRQGGCGPALLAAANGTAAARDPLSNGEDEGKTQWEMLDGFAPLPGMAAGCWGAGDQIRGLRIRSGG